MKKLLQGTLIIISCFVVAVLFSCSENSAKLKAAIEEANKECPISLGIAGEMTSMAYSNNTVEILFSFDEQFTNIDKLAANPARVKETVMTAMVNERSKPLFDLMVEANANFRVIFKGKSSGKEAKMELQLSELEDLMKKPMASNEEKLRLTIAQTNLQMPMDTGTGVVITELLDRGDAVIYKAKVSKKEQLSMIANSIEEVKNSQKLMFKMMGTAEKVFFRMVIDAGKDIGYLYTADGTDEQVEIIQTNAELKEILQ